MGRAFPVIVGAVIFASWKFGMLYGAALGSSVLLDLESVVLFNKAAGGQKFGVTIVAALLNYPLFYCLAFAGWAAGLQGPIVGYLTFVFSSLSRYVYLRLSEETQTGGPAWSVKSGWGLAVQQPLNFALFRDDQLVLSAQHVLPGQDAPRLGYFFLTRFTEVASAVSVALAPIIHPVFFTAMASKARLSRIALWYSGGSVLVLPVALYFYSRLAGQGVVIAYQLLLPFAFTTLLVMPTNFLAYYMLRTNQLERLIHYELAAIVAGTVVLGIYFRSGDLGALAWLVPAQMAVLLAFGATTVFTVRKQ